MSVKKYCYCENNCRYETLSKEEIYAAITQAVETGTIGNCDTGFITTIKTVNGQPLKFFVGTQSEYNALTDKENLFAIITSDITADTLLAAVREVQAGQTDLETRFNAFSDGVINGGVYAKNATNATNANTLINNITKVGSESISAEGFSSGLYAFILCSDETVDGETYTFYHTSLLFIADSYEYGEICRGTMNDYKVYAQLSYGEVRGQKALGNGSAQRIMIYGYKKLC